MKVILNSLIITCSVVAAASLSLSGQTIVWSSPDKTFSVEVPEKLEKDNNPGYRGILGSERRHRFRVGQEETGRRGCCSKICRVCHKEYRR